MSWMLYMKKASLLAFNILVQSSSLKSSCIVRKAFIKSAYIFCVKGLHLSYILDNKAVNQHFIHEQEEDGIIMTILPFHNSLWCGGCYFGSILEVRSKFCNKCLNLLTPKWILFSHFWLMKRDKWLLLLTQLHTKVSVIFLTLCKDNFYVNRKVLGSAKLMLAIFHFTDSIIYIYIYIYIWMGTEKFLVFELRNGMT